MNTLQLHRNDFYTASIDDFLEALEQKEMQYSCASLQFVYHTPEEIQQAVLRSMRICNAMGIDLRQHFRRRFLSSEAIPELQIDWNLSKLAYCLMLLNGDADNKLVARFQWELLQKMR
jgi:hypothetical protein